MPKVRIQATETITYEKTCEVTQETLDMMLESAQANPRTINAGDFTLDLSDVNDGELDMDLLEIDVFEGGKWRSALDTH